MSGLTYQQVVDQVLTENRRAADQFLCHLQEHRTHEREALERLIKVHGELDKADKATWKSLKKEIDQRRNGLETLKERISHYEAQLEQEPSEGSAPTDDDQVHHGAQAEVAPAPVANCKLPFCRKLLFAGFLVPLCPKRALVWGTVVRGFVRRDLC